MAALPQIDPSTHAWFQDHPILGILIGLGAVALLILLLVLFYWAKGNWRIDE